MRSGRYCHKTDSVTSGRRKWRKIGRASRIMVLQTGYLADRVKLIDKYVAERATIQTWSTDGVDIGVNHGNLLNILHHVAMPMHSHV